MMRRDLVREVLLVRKLSEPEASLASTDNICALFARRIAAALVRQEQVTLRGLGTFYVRPHKVHLGADRATEGVRDCVYFRPALSLKKSIRKEQGPPRA